MRRNISIILVAVMLVAMLPLTVGAYPTMASGAEEVTVDLTGEKTLAELNFTSATNVATSFVGGALKAEKATTSAQGWINLDLDSTKGYSITSDKLYTFEYKMKVEDASAYGFVEQFALGASTNNASEKWVDYFTANNDKIWLYFYGTGSGSYKSTVTNIFSQDLGTNKWSSDWVSIKYYIDTDTNGDGVSNDCTYYLLINDALVYSDTLSSSRYGSNPKPRAITLKFGSSASGTVWLKDIKLSSGKKQTATAIFADAAGDEITALPYGGTGYATVATVGTQTATLEKFNASGISQGSQSVTNSVTLTPTSAEAGYSYVLKILDGATTVTTKTLKISTPLSAFTALQSKSALNVVYLGGSITDGTAATNYNTDSWRALVGEWLKTQLPNAAANITNINTGVGGTGSDYGLLRLQNDVISKNPDVVFVEFAVNDRLTDVSNVQKQMEGIVRSLMAQPKVPYIIFVYTAVKSTDTPKPSAVAHEAVAKHYGIPSIDLESYLNAKYAGNAAVRDALFSDGVHPNDSGHAAYAAYIKKFLNNASEAFKLPVMPQSPLTAYYDVTGTIVKASDMTANGSWTASGTSRTSSDTSATLSYSFSGTTIAMVNRRNTNSGKIKIVIDGGEPIIKDAYINGNNSYPSYINFTLPAGNHTIAISPAGEKNEDSSGTAVTIDSIIFSPSGSVTPDPETKVNKTVDLSGAKSVAELKFTAPVNVTASVDGASNSLKVEKTAATSGNGDIQINFNDALYAVPANELYTMEYKFKLDSASSPQLIAEFASGFYTTSAAWVDTLNGQSSDLLWVYDYKTRGGSTQIMKVKDVTGLFSQDTGTWSSDWVSVKYFFDMDTNNDGTVGDCTYHLLINGVEIYKASLNSGRYGALPKPQYIDFRFGSSSTGTVWFKDMAVSSDKKTHIKVDSTSIDGNEEHVPGNSIDINFNYPLKVENNLSGMVTMLKDGIPMDEMDYSSSLVNDNQTIRITFGNLRTKTNYAVKVGKALAPVELQSGEMIFAMASDYILPFRSTVGDFDVESVTVNDAVTASLETYAGTAVTVKVKMTNVGLTQAQDIQAFVVLVDGNGKMLDLDRQEENDIALGTSRTPQFTINIPSDATSDYKLNVFTWTADGKIVPLYYKIILPE